MENVAVGQVSCEHVGSRRGSLPFRGRGLIKGFECGCYVLYRCLRCFSYTHIDITGGLGATSWKAIRPR